MSKFDWNQIGDVIAKLAMIALRWYMVVNGKSNGDIIRGSKQLALVIDPDLPDVETMREADARIPPSDSEVVE
jgi:hypothetical protein